MIKDNGCIKVRVEFSNIQHRKSVGKNQQNRNWSLENINKIGKHSARLTKKRRKTQVTKAGMKEGIF